MSDFKRRAGQTLGLKLSLFPRDDTKFVRAFLTNKSGVALTPTATVDLPSVGNGDYVDNTFVMPSTDQVNAKYIVFTDAAFTIEDCEHPGGEDVFDLDDLLPTQLPGDEVLEAEINSVELQANLTDGEMVAEIETASVEAELEDTENLEAETDAVDLDADSDSTELEANKEC